MVGALPSVEARLWDSNQNFLPGGLRREHNLAMRKSCSPFQCRWLLNCFLNDDMTLRKKLCEWGELVMSGGRRLGVGRTFLPARDWDGRRRGNFSPCEFRSTFFELFELAKNNSEEEKFWPCHISQMWSKINEFIRVIVEHHSLAPDGGVRGVLTLFRRWRERGKATRKMFAVWKAPARVSSALSPVWPSGEFSAVWKPKAACRTIADALELKDLCSFEVFSSN